MKNLTILILVLFTLSCQKTIKTRPVIISKSCYTVMGNELPKGLFRYTYKREINTWQEPIDFIDTEGKYNIGDTIK